jgi:hypothetical protein
MVRADQTPGMQHQGGKMPAPTLGNAILPINQLVVTDIRTTFLYCPSS